MIDTIDKLRCLERQISLRKTDYPKWVRFSQEWTNMADRDVLIMEAIREDYIKGRIK